LTKFEVIPLRLGKGKAIQVFSVIIWLTKDADEAGFIDLINHHFKANPFYFSYTYNLTNSLQRNTIQHVSPSTPFWERSDDRFFWNRYLQSALIDFRKSNGSSEIDAFILPVIFGFLHIQHTFANHKALTLALISRRSRYRVGTRFFSRGLDAEGHTSNFNETEQMLLVPSPAGQKWMSYVQTRGSIPLYWAEMMDLKYKPKLRIFGNLDKAVSPSMMS
jgi:phosphatidylinositol 4-phosphatase